MCDLPHPIYVPSSNEGIVAAISQGDGYTIAITWTKAYPDAITYNIAYNIYYSTLKPDIYNEGVKFVSIGGLDIYTEITNLTPGDIYYFGVRAFEYDPSWYDLTKLPKDGYSSIYPEGALLADLNETSTTIPITDIESFPSFGVVQIGYERIRYGAIDLWSSSLINLTRGFLDSNITIHQMNGFDGYVDHDNPLVVFWAGMEDHNTVVMQETCDFSFPTYPYTIADGFKIVQKDNLTTDLGGSDDSNGAISVTDGGTTADSLAAVPPIDTSGYRRTPITSLFDNSCLNSFIGGRDGCAIDGYGNIIGQINGNILQANTQRQEQLLSVTGESVVLIRKRYTGIVCSCFSADSEYPDNRCYLCHGSGYAVSWDQFYNPRRSDSRIMVRFGPTEDDLVLNESGLESTFIPDCFTLVMPAVKDRDVIVRFQEDGITEEFRYEILNVTRNKLLDNTLGGQKFKVQRIRKTDPIYTIRINRDTSNFPILLTTGLTMDNRFPPHAHTVDIASDKVVSVSQINQTTGITLDHNHDIINGIISPAVGDLKNGYQGHTHTLTIP